MEQEKQLILSIIGLGNMGGALLSGIVRSGLVKKEKIAVFDIDPKKVKKYEKVFKVRALYDLKELILSSKYILLAVKPQNIHEIMPSLKKYCSIRDNVIISIAAGIPTIYFEANIGNIPVLRIMPNTPALYGKGVSAVSKGKFVKKEHIDFTESMMSSTGFVVLLDEKFQNLATAISGSGPAYFFLFCSFLINFAIKNGLDARTAKRMVINTMLGSGEVLNKTDKTIDELIKSVASPGGTTEKALDSFYGNDLEKIFIEALNAALKRSVKMESVISIKQ
ncbi:MAG: pyrroline-5-carboxylate reductase [Candidatus Humimicrobiaceae bacterium]